MHESRPALFRDRHFRDEMIVLCVRWYLRYPLSYRDLEEMMAVTRPANLIQLGLADSAFAVVRAPG